MAPAVDECPWPLRPLHAGEPVVAVIAVALQEAPAEALQEVFGIGAAAPRRIAEQHDRRTGAAMAPVIGGDRPEEALLRLPAPGIEHRSGGLVHEQAVGRGQMLAHVPGDRLQMEAGAAGPVAQGGPVEPDPLPGEDLGLPVERQASRAGESHPRALPEPYVSLSTHTAPSVRPLPCTSDQWANRSGDVRITRASQSRAPFGCCRRRLNLRRAHRMRNASIRFNVG